jgi:arylsulfatase A-like enzyme
MKNLALKIYYNAATLLVIAAGVSVFDAALALKFRPNRILGIPDGLSFLAQDTVVYLVFLGVLFALSAALVFPLTALARKYKKIVEYPLVMAYAVSTGILLTVIVAVYIGFAIFGIPDAKESKLSYILLLALVPELVFILYKLGKIFNSRVLRKITPTGLIPTICSVIVVIIVLAGFIFEPVDYPAVRNEYTGRPNVLLITIDAQRRDYFSFMGNQNVNTPNVDRLAEKSVVFTNAYANAPWTVPSMFTMHTSSYPSVHGANIETRGSDQLPTLAEILRENGYDTEAYTANTLLDEETGFNRGFVRYHGYEDIPALKWAHRTTLYYMWAIIREKRVTRMKVDTTEWLTGVLCNRLAVDRDRPFFIWAHYLDPHEPLTPPDKFIDGGPDVIETAHEFMPRQVPDVDIRDKDIALKLYAAEVEYVDYCLGKVFGVMEKQGLMDNTLIIVTADHGEEHFEHGTYGHGKSHFRPVLAIPMLVSGPGLTPAECSYPVDLTDVMPTILAYTGIGDENETAGENMLELVGKTPGKPEDAVIFFEANGADTTMKSIYLYPYIISRTGEKVYRYELRDTRIETGPEDLVTDADEAALEKYRTTLDAWAEKVKEEAAEYKKKAVKLGESKREHLKNLGYI